MPIKKFLLVVFLFISAYSFSQNDCVDAIIVCGSSDYTGLSVNGYGIQELSGANSCAFDESNSIWMKLSIRTGGTLGFILTPESISIQEDFDFYIFGPNVTCGNLGMSIRCSTTNPEMANASDNLTGMNDTETDVSEGPGPDGNSFVKSLTVNAGETYFLVIDRPVGQSNFSIAWTGTATFNESPTSQVPAGISMDMKNCENEFDLELNTPHLLGSQTNVGITYHRNQSDALTGTNTIPNSTRFESTQNPQRIYARLTNTTTGCFSIEDFEISMYDPIIIANDFFTKCDDLSDGDDQNGLTAFSLVEITDFVMQGQNLTGLTIAYYQSALNASTNILSFSSNFTNSIPVEEPIFIKVTNVYGCSVIKEIKLTVKPVPAIINATLTQCDTKNIPDGLTKFNLNEALPQLTNNDPNLTVDFSYLGTQILSEYTNISNPQQIDVLITNNLTSCSSMSTLELNVNLLPPPILTIPAQCDLLHIEDGFREFNLHNSSLVLNPGETVAYYKTNDDALLETNAIGNSSNYTNEIAYEQTIFVRTENTNNCAGISKLVLKVLPLPKLAPDYSEYICTNFPNQHLTLNSGLVGNINNYNFEWSTGENTPTIRTNIPRTYTVKVIPKNSIACEKIRTITILPSNNATISAIDIVDNSENNTATVQLTDSSIGYYLYSIDAPTGPFHPSNHFENIKAGFHTIYVYDERGCGIVSKEISVLKLPKFFTPNGDGRNDTWDIVGISPKFYAKSKIYIFDRFGKLLADINPLSNGWNGTFDGQPLPSSDYWYVIKLDSGRTIKGHFSLLR